MIKEKLLIGNKKIAEYHVGKTAEYIRKSINETQT